MKKELEEGSELNLDFTKLSGLAGSGCIPVAVQNSETLEVVLLAYTNREAMLEAFKTRRLILWSTSRNELWEKGAVSGARFRLVKAFVNCEQNSLLYMVRPLDDDPACGICHTRNQTGQYRNCFYRRIDFDTLELDNGNR